MELLLNIAWILLVVPAYWLWRRGAVARMGRRVSALQCVLALGCAFVLLFPVISATDDLHAMRAEMEESSASKRAVRQATSEKHSAWLNRLQGTPAQVASAIPVITPKISRLEISVLRKSPAAAPRVAYAGRAPPCTSLLG